MRTRFMLSATENHIRQAPIAVLMRVLVDQDNVLADFDGRLIARWAEVYPDRPPLARNHKDFYMHKSYPAYSAEIKALAEEQGFFWSLEPLDGALEALLEMSEEHDVWICTAPLSAYRNCVREKYEWVEAHLGLDWTKRIIMTKDKTTIAGDVLIDDRPSIRGRYIPLWSYLQFDRPYNRHTNWPRMTWATWREALAAINKKPLSQA
ncbi:5'-3'-deoxyribonucleotidase [Candidatus Woesearchaeota archaeon]|nr:MAG: 5'-3'-deoxyribonucleotidase [Candidatus Woesearchaeota archaeon]